MATNRKVREALLAKLGTKQKLSRLVAQKRKGAAMNSTEAAYLVAHDLGIRIDRHLGAEEMERVRALQSMVRSESPSSATTRRHRATAYQPTREVRFADNFKLKDPVLSAAKISEAIAVAKIYPHLYVLENSVREVVKRVMRAAHGDDWWDAQMTSGKLKGVHKTAADRMTTEKRQSWHQRRGSHPIDYVDFKELGAIIDAKQDLFFDRVISDRDFFTSMMRELTPSRNVVCHMNPLDDHNERDVKLKCERWARMIGSTIASIPE